MADVRAIDPIRLVMLDGSERAFLLSIGGLRRLKQRFGVKSLKELLEKDEDCVASVLFEALLERGEMTEERFFDILPSHPETMGRALAMLLGASFPESKNGDRPPVPLESTMIQRPN